MSIAVALLLAQAGAAQVDCANANTQQDMNFCAAQDFAKADEELNAQWSVTAAAMRRRDANTFPPDDGRPGYFDQLLAAQRSWLTFRDAHCASEGYQVRGGSMEPMLVAGCRAALTRDRTAQLRSLTANED